MYLTGATYFELFRSINVILEASMMVPVSVVVLGVSPPRPFLWCSKDIMKAVFAGKYVPEQIACL